MARRSYEKLELAADIFGNECEITLNTSVFDENLKNSNRPEERSVEEMVNDGDFELGGNYSITNLPYRLQRE